MTRARRCLAAAVLFLAMLPGAGISQDQETREQAAIARLEELKQQIANLQQRISTRSGERDALQESLRETETEIGSIDVELSRIQELIAAELPKLEALDQERSSLEAALSEAQASMGNEIRSLWSIRQGGGVRILFGDQSPDKLSRNLAYFRKLLAARNESLDRFAALLDKVEANANAIRASQQRLAQQRQALEDQREESLSLQARREHTLAAIDRELASDAAKVSKLEEDRRQLGILLEELERALAELDTPASYKPFAQARGEMPLPIRAKPSKRFGQRRNAGNMRWRGWLMPAREGTEVGAIHHGRVVYADWLRGQGLLLILDHGEGYLSLYGQNRSLQREVGDWVRPGDVLATVGASGGAETPALYFEIRKNGDPVDPGKWLKD